MKHTSKLLALVLRHKPEQIGIELDAQGWVAVDRLLEALDTSGHSVTRTELERLVAENDKKRFTLSQDGRRIRAAQGHSVHVALGLEPMTPPDVLYHGTAVGNLVSIREKGLVPGSRQQVHLSADTETARKVGMRHGKPHILRVDAARMQAEGCAFYCADNGVWLCDGVDPIYLSDA